MSGYGVTYSGIGLCAALVLVMALPLLEQLRRGQRQPFLFYSQLSDLPSKLLSSWRRRWLGLKEGLFLASIAFFAMALTNITLVMPPLPPGAEGRLPGQPIHTPTEGTALYFVLDISGSMAHQVPYEGGGGLPPIIPKIDLAKTLTERFILGDQQLELPGRSDDLIGLVSFARKANILAPLTLDHAAVVDKIRHLTVVDTPSDDGTGIGYAIYKTASTIAATRYYGEQLPSNEKPAYQILSNAIILVTDGFQSPNEQDKGNWLRTLGMEDAAEYAKEQGIKVYIVNIEPSLAKPEFEPHRHLLQRVAEMTGGKFFLAENLDDLPKIYREIDTLEKNVIPAPSLPHSGRIAASSRSSRELPLYPLLVFIGMVCLGAAIVIETRAAKVAP